MDSCIVSGQTGWSCAGNVKAENIRFFLNVRCGES